MRNNDFISLIRVLILAFTVLFNSTLIAGEFERHIREDGSLNLQEIQATIDSLGLRFSVTKNYFTNMTVEQRKLYTGALSRDRSIDYPKSLHRPELMYPSFLDWRNFNGNNYVTGVRDQGNCGSCWLFSSVAMVESRLLIASEIPGQDIDLSEQYVLSCISSFFPDDWLYTNDCAGGYHEDALTFLVHEGTPTEVCFTYEANDGIPCNNSCSETNDLLATLAEWSWVTTFEVKNFNNIKAALQEGPVVTTIGVHHSLYAYSGGIYSAHGSGYTGMDHAVLLVGYNDVEQYWIAKNSWDTTWGEEGFFRLSYDSGCQFGQWTARGSCNPIIVPQILSAKVLNIFAGIDLFVQANVREGTYPISNFNLFYRVDRGPTVKRAVTYQGSDTWSALLGQYSAGTKIAWRLEVQDQYRIKTTWPEDSVWSTFTVIEPAMAVYVSSTGDPGNSGLSPGETLNSISDGIERAAYTGAPVVKVAEGTYTTSSTIEMIEGISLYGGYNQDFTVRNPLLHETVINDIQPGEQWTRTFNFASGITNQTTLDGFTVNGGKGNSTHLIVIRIMGAPTISNNIIRGWLTGSLDRAITVHGDGGAVIINNTIVCRSDHSTDQGIYVDAFAIIVNNIILSSGNGSSRLVTFRGGSGAVLYNNLIIGGSATTNFVIHIEGSNDIDIRNNIIYGANGTTIYGLWEQNNDQGPAILQNNNFFGLNYLARLRRGGMVTLVTDILDLNNNEILSPTLSGENINIDMITNGYFVDADNGDWRLAVHCPGSISRGGHDLSVEFAALGIPGVDRNGNPRIEKAWSIGPYDASATTYTGVPVLPPASFNLEQNFPNPFNPATTISFSLPIQAKVQLVIYDPAGRKVRSLFDGVLVPGRYHHVWDGQCDMGRLVSSGIYYYRIMAGNEIQTRKLILLR